MKLDEYIIKDGKKLRLGYTTGSCAHAATKACIEAIDKGKFPEYINIDTPAGIELKLEVEEGKLEDNKAYCCIRKDAGDDPDVTDGILICSEVSLRDDYEYNLDGGLGVGRITRKGLFGEIGEAAINPVPKKIILKELKSYKKSGLDCKIIVPEGEAIGKKTFNSQIGIEGGISIIGTKGIVYPMSESAFVASINMELDMRRLESDSIILTPGNYGKNFLEEMALDAPVVKMANFVGESLTYAYSIGFKKFVLLGHIGKFAKLSLGIFNTHNRYADTRMEAFVYYLAINNEPYELIEEISNCLSAENAMNKLIKYGKSYIIKEMEKGSEERIKKYLKDKDLDVKVYIYSMEEGLVK
ncbi:MAG: cobalt-precorrin-5B (C(1))-methyltransferase CbiD [Tissierellia bacterium]|nr:cobalt-precorrin-5B (C(1))-methyltransferase CbiD [Tissierellia bacterium]